MGGSLWRVVGGDAHAFARPEIARGTYVEGEAPAALVARAPDGRCPGCGGPVPRSRRAQPLGLEWPTTAPLTMGDFTWPVGSHYRVLRARRRPHDAADDPPAMR